MNDGGRDALARELYWAADSASVDVPSRTQSARVAADRLAHRLRRELQHAAPWSDPGLALSRGWRRRVKVILHRAFRPVGRRYERLAAELAEINVQLAESFIQLEREVRRLRQDLAEMERRQAGPDRVPGEG
jgi:hypothetical protein